MSGRLVLPPQPWMTAEATRRLVAALADDGTEVRFVGGCVRDAAAGRPSSDVDLATPDTPDIVMAKLRRAGLRAIPTGLSHGTVTALVGEARYEITTLRRDVETDGRHATVAFTADWRADAARRDFTINALSATPDGVVHDYFGGADDLAARRVVFVGEPAARIAEDVLRVLRFYRFHARYGRGAPDGAARAACREAAAAGAIARLSGERVRDELLKLLGAPVPADAVEAMAQDGVLAAVAPALSDVSALRALVAIETGDGAPLGAPSPVVPVAPLRRLAALIALGSDGVVAAIAERLRLSTAERDRLLATRGPIPELPAAEAAREAALRRWLYRAGAVAAADRLLLRAARSGGEHEHLVSDLRILHGAILPRFPLGGADVLALGIAPGPRVGALLHEVESWWLAADLGPDRDSCLARLKALV